MPPRKKTAAPPLQSATLVTDAHPYVEYLDIRNIKAIESLTLDAKDLSAIIISGYGGVGKTTALDLLTAILMGGTEASRKMLRAGEKEGWVETRINGVKARYTWDDSHEKPKLEVLDTRTGQAGSRMSLSDEFFGVIPRPIEFMRKKPEDQVKQLLSTVQVDPAMVKAAAKALLVGPTGLDRKEIPERMRTDLAEWTFEHDTWLQRLEQLYSVYYAFRAEANGAQKDAKEEVDALKRQFPVGYDPEEAAPTPPQGIGGLYAQRNAIVDYNHRREDRIARIEKIDQQILALQQERGECVEWLDGPGLCGLDEIDAQIASYETAQLAYNEQAQAHLALKSLYAQAVAKDQRYIATNAAWQLLDQTVKQLKDLPGEILRTAKLPIEGVEITAGSIMVLDENTHTYVPLAERGDSQKMDFCVELAMALAPENCKVLLVDGAESMDGTQRAALVEKANARGFQVIMTVVADMPRTVETKRWGETDDTVIIDGKTIDKTTGEVLSSVEEIDEVISDGTEDW
jgi:energy-coupling factor transporter ATP-binding protein EcfA2